MTVRDLRNEQVDFCVTVKSSVAKFEEGSEAKPFAIPQFFKRLNDFVLILGEHFTTW
jgi:hypothetical protein